MGPGDENVFLGIVCFFVTSSLWTTLCFTIG